MAVFRENEAREQGFERARRYLVPRAGEATPAEREKALQVLTDLVAELGPVVEAYPIWHPLVAQLNPVDPVTDPDERSGYRGLDHTIYFAHGFVTCPYGAPEIVVASVEDAGHPGHKDRDAYLSAEIIDAPLYRPGTTPVVVRCNWSVLLESGHFVPRRQAIGRMIEGEVRQWRDADVSESWETMRPYFLGDPYGARSSLFVTQETGMAMKRAWIAISESGMFGRIISRGWARGAA